MTIQVATDGSAREEIEFILEYDPPPDFKKVQDAVNWAEINLPLNTYFEVWGKNDRIWFQGFNMVSRRKR